MPVYYPHGPHGEAYMSLRCALLNAWATPVEIASTDDFRLFHVPSNPLATKPEVIAGIVLAFQQRADAVLDVQRNYELSKRKWPGLSQMEVVDMFRFIDTTGFLVPIAWPERHPSTSPQTFPTMLRYTMRVDLVNEASSLGILEPAGDIVWSTPLRADVSGGKLPQTIRSLRAQRDMLFMTLGQKETIG